MRKVVSGGLLVFFGLFMLLGFLVSERSSPLLATAVQLLLMVAAPVAVGLGLVRSHFQSQKKNEEESRKAMMVSREKEVLRLAKQKDGEITITEIVSESSMSMEEAEEIMRELVLRRFADMKITESGTVIYEFPEFRRQEPEDRKKLLESWTESDVN